MTLTFGQVSIKHYTLVAMGSMNVYWIPYCEFTRRRRYKSQHIKAVPKQNTDVKDAERIAKLFLHGLFKASLEISLPIYTYKFLYRGNYC